ncbi:MAG TPA: hypothetical protein VGF60_19950 [Xanthobacteraceae bacterium]|jgi:hypothetical protein
MLQRRTIIIAAAGLLLAAAVPAHAADTASPNDTARFLAGMPPAADSPLAALTRERAWQEHARIFDGAFERLEQRQLARIRSWSSGNLAAARPTMFYMFSGPDFLYANAFYPKATTYVLSALEPVGTVPDLTTLRGSIAPNLQQLRASLSTILSYSFFITHNMRSDLRAGRVNGTLPILYVFLARSGKTIREVTPVRLDAAGAVEPDIGAVRGEPTRGVKIVFAGSDGEPRTLYYFSTNLADDGVRSSKFLTFCETLAPGDSLIKSASYLLHSGSFSKVREFLLANSAAMIQDDSGIPLGYYAPGKWELQPFGHYNGPIAVFPGRYQPKYAALFRKSHPIDFGIGYRWRPNESNLLLAVRTAADGVPEASARSAAEEPAPESAASRPAAPVRTSSARPRRAPARHTVRQPFDWFFRYR